MLLLILAALLCSDEVLRLNEVLFCPPISFSFSHLLWVNSNVFSHFRPTYMLNMSSDVLHLRNSPCNQIGFPIFTLLLLHKDSYLRIRLLQRYF